jgi:hypothetical protein
VTIETDMCFAFYKFTNTYDFLLVALGAELSLVLGRQAIYNLSYAPRPFFLLITFEIGSYFMSRLGWTTILFLLPYETEMIGMCHCTQPLVEMEIF